jgi:hypothetical protein
VFFSDRFLAVTDPATLEAFTCPEALFEEESLLLAVANKLSLT